MLRKSYFLKTNLTLLKIGLIKYQVYKAAALLNIISSVIFVMLQYYLWKAIYSANSVPGYSFNQMFIYICISQFIFTLFPQTSRDISNLVKKGDIIHWLLKPIGIIRQFLFESFGISTFKLINISIPVLIIVFLIFQINPALNSIVIIKFLAVLGLSYLFIFLFEIFIGLCSFYTLSTWGIQSFKYAVITLLSGRFLPIALYPEKIRILINYMPFKFMYYYPLTIISNNMDTSFKQMITYQLFWIGVMALFVTYFYKKVLKRLMIQGG